MVIDRLTGGLDQENVRATNSFFQGYRGFAVGEGFHCALTHVESQFFANCLGEFGIGVTAEDLNILSVCNHR
jgi:hypothetical protein